MEEAEVETQVEEAVTVSEEPEFVVNFPEEKIEEEKKEDDIPFEIKNPPKGEQLGLF
jgi:topoisomerase-4 subunit A